MGKGGAAPTNALQSDENSRLMKENGVLKLKVAELNKVVTQVPVVHKDALARPRWAVLGMQHPGLTCCALCSSRRRRKPKKKRFVSDTSRCAGSRSHTVGVAPRLILAPPCRPSMTGGASTPLSRRFISSEPPMPSLAR